MFITNNINTYKTAIKQKHKSTLFVFVVWLCVFGFWNRKTMKTSQIQHRRADVSMATNVKSITERQLANVCQNTSCVRLFVLVIMPLISICQYVMFTSKKTSEVQPALDVSNFYKQYASRRLRSDVFVQAMIVYLLRLLCYLPS